MIYHVLSPQIYYGQVINGNSFKEAMKNFVKLHHGINLTQLIMTDQQRHMEATLEYYQKDGRNKVGINYYPASPTVISGLPLGGLVPGVGITSPMGVISPVISSPVITSSGPIVGPGYDIGPTVGHVLSPISPTFLYNNRPLVTTAGSRIGTTANSVVVSPRRFGSVFDSPTGFIPTIIDMK
jgi:hypothetical protein